MPVSTSIYTSFATSENEFDINEFIMSILLFDCVLISNAGSIPKLVNEIGLHGLVRLLEEGRLSVVGGDPTAQATLDYRSPGFSKHSFKPLQFGFDTVYVKTNAHRNRSAEERILDQLMTEKNGYGLSKIDANIVLEKAIPSLKFIDGESLTYGAEIQDDVFNKQDLVADILVSRLARIHNLPVSILNFELSVEKVAENIYQINTNLGKCLNKNDDELHNYLKQPFFEFTGTNLQLLRMKSVEAASGLTEAQLEITAKRIDFLSKIIIDADSRLDFTRVRNLANIPILEEGDSINIDQLIELRESTEAYAFRNWLQNSNQYSDKEVEDMVSNLKIKIGEFLSSGRVKQLRWLSSTGVGVLIGDVAGITTSVIDNFLDKFFPGSGPIGFISKEYKQFIKKSKSKN